MYEAKSVGFAFIPAVSKTYLQSPGSKCPSTNKAPLNAGL